MQSLTTQDIVELEKRDEAQILAEIQGNVIDEMVYSFKVGSREVTGISWVGIKELARMYGKIDVDLVQLTETDEQFIVIVKARDIERGNSMLGTSTQAKVMKTGKGDQMDPFALPKAMSKAQRNAIRSLIPETFMKEVFKQLANNGKKPKPRQVEAQVNPFQPKSKRDQLAQAIDKAGLNVMNLDIEDNEGLLTITPVPDLTEKVWKQFNTVFTGHGGKWNEVSWEVEV